MCRARLLLVSIFCLSGVGCSQELYDTIPVQPPATAKPGRPVFCPEYLPGPGEPCTASPTRCSWDDGACGASGFCRYGSWEIQHRECPRPAPVCPSAAPLEGSPCTIVEGGVCRYDNACGGRDEAICKGGAFHLTRGACGCPKVAVNEDDTCVVEGQSCSWPAACGDVSTASCSGGKWRTTRVDCSACPSAMPAPGDGCAIEGTTCSYESSGCLRTCGCADGKIWSCSECSG